MGSIQMKGFFISSFLCWVNSINGQIPESKYEIGVNLSAYIYQGTLSPPAVGSLRTLMPGAGLFVNRILNTSFSIRGNLSYGNLRGSDQAYPGPEWRAQRNLKFYTPVIEGSVVGVWSIRGKNGSRNKDGLAPYIFAGLGYSYLDIHRDWAGFNASYFGGEGWVVRGLAIDTLHSVPRGLPVIPVGAGLRYSLGSHISLNTELSYRVSFTQYLDGFSQVSPHPRNDYYYSVSTGIIYSFGEKNRLACPPVPH